eukprot:1725198-Rhodomonas_salina.1
MANDEVDVLSQCLCHSPALASIQYDEAKPLVATFSPALDQTRQALHVEIAAEQLQGALFP